MFYSFETEVIPYFPRTVEILQNKRSYFAFLFRRSNGIHETKLSKPANQQTLGVSSSHHTAFRQSSLPSQLLPRGEIGGGRVNLAHENSSDEDSVEDEVNEKEAMIQAQQVTGRKSSGSGRKAPTSSHISSTQSLQQVYTFYCFSHICFKMEIVTHVVTSWIIL